MRIWLWCGVAFVGAAGLAAVEGPPVPPTTPATEPAWLFWDLDVSVPPGLPLDWVDALPRPYANEGEAIATVVPPVASADARYAKKRRAPQIVLPSSFGLVRILTWDIVNHLNWINPASTERKTRPVTGPQHSDDSLRYPPPINDAQFWMSASAMLRLMLHPAQTSRHETLAYLLTMGDGASRGLDAMQSDAHMGKDAAWLRKQIGRMPSKFPTVPRGATPYQTMMLRFTAEELVSGHPFDPDMNFGRRMFLLGRTATCFIGLHALSDHELLRRNATAAVGRSGSTGSEDVLLRVLADFDDPVCRMRAIQGLGECRKQKVVGPLISQLGRSKYLLESCALIRALGRLGDDRAADAVYAFGKKHKGDGDILMTVLTALSRLRIEKRRVEAIRWLVSVRKSTLNSPRRWRVGQGALRPDVPDPDDLRAIILHQTCLLALHRQGEASIEEVLAILSSERPATSRRERYDNDTLGGVQPTVAPAFLELASRLGGEGHELLCEVALDVTMDPILRSRALALLPVGRQSETALELADEDSRHRARDRDSSTIRIYAFEVLDELEHPAVVEIATEIVGRGRGGRFDRRPLADRYLLLLALKALGQRGRLQLEQVAPFLENVDLRPTAAPSFEAEVRKTVSRIVTRARRVQAEELRPEITTLLGRVVDSGFSSPLRRETLDRSLEYVVGQLEAVSNAGQDPAIAAVVHDEVVTYLLGRGKADPALADGREGRFQSSPEVPLLEAVVVELGRTRDPGAIAELTKILKVPGHPLAPVACLALGATGLADARPLLVQALDSDDGFTRLCAYEALRSLTRRNHFADWLYGSRSSRLAAIEAYAKGGAE